MDTEQEKLTEHRKLKSEIITETKTGMKMRNTVFNSVVWPSHTTPAGKAAMNSVEGTKRAIPSVLRRKYEQAWCEGKTTDCSRQIRSWAINKIQKISCRTRTQCTLTIPS